MGTATRGTASVALARAAVLVSFEDTTFLGKGVDSDEAFDILNEQCELVVTPTGHDKWTLRDHPRRVALATIPLARLRKARQDVKPDEDSATQRALDQSLAGGWSRADLDHLPAEDARALAAVAGWWQGRNERVPELTTVTAVLEQTSLFSDMREMAGDHFTGRRSMLDHLRSHLMGEGPPVYALHGIGGIGKSALLAKHVVWAVDEADALVAPLDFDDSTLNAFFSLDILAKVVSMIARQTTGEVRMKLDRLMLVAEDAANTSRYRSESSSESFERYDVRGVRDTVARLAKIPARPILVVFDTAEQVQRRGPSAVEAFAALVRELGRDGLVRIVVSGRAEVPELGMKSHPVSGLSRDEAVTLLLELCARPLLDQTAALVIDSFGTSPLTVRLLARLLADDDEDAELNDLVPLDLHSERVNAELYSRVLLHIRDREVRKLAHPGLVLRRVASDIIKTVLARPCGVKVESDFAARSLFDRLALEVMLVERSHESPDVLVHRSDIRSLMLPQLLADKPELSARIQRAAVRYYAKRDDVASRTEELYHRLMLDQKARTIDAHWDPAAGNALWGVREELPPGARLLLTERLPESFLNEEDRQLVSDNAWVREVEPQISRLLASGAYDKALGLLRERRGARGASLLPSLEIDALERVGDVAGAIALARNQRQLASLANDRALLTTFTLHIVRLDERVGDIGGAAASLEEALASIRDDSTDRLRLVVALLGLWRRTGLKAADLEARTAEAIELYEKAGVRRVRQVPGLLRDLAAEVGATDPAIQDAALRAIGVDALTDGLVPDALRTLDDRVNTESDYISTVADVARLDKGGDDGTVDWKAIATKPRGETGRILLDVIEAFPEGVSKVRDAVTNDYQQEADAALFGRELELSIKA